MATEQGPLNAPVDPLRQQTLTAELLATLSHELRSPLTAIKGYAATLLRRRRISPEERRAFLSAIVEASDRLEHVVERLVEISQLETGAIRLERSHVDVARLAREALAVAEQRAGEQAQAAFSFHLRLGDASGASAQDVPIILADPRRLREVLDQLLENAMSYSPQGGAIEIIVHPVDAHLSLGEPASAAEGVRPQKAPALASKAGRALEICVCDHGLGIPPEHLGRVFDRFHRVDTRLIREVYGLGLGLTVCKYLIELHGGLIWAESCPAGGSAFHVQLLLDAQEDGAGAVGPA